MAPYVHPSSLVKEIDKISGASYLVDTGSSFSILPYSSSSIPTGPLLKSANSQKIPCWGRRQLTVQFNSCHYTWWFLLAAVDFHIIGINFLRHFNLLVDVSLGLFTSHSHSADTSLAAAILLSSSSHPTLEAPSPPSLHTVEALELGHLQPSRTCLCHLRQSRGHHQFHSYPQVKRLFSQSSLMS